MIILKSLINYSAFTYLINIDKIWKSIIRNHLEEYEVISLEKGEIKSYFSGEKLLTNNRFITRAKLNSCTFFKNNKIKFKYKKEIQI